MSARYFLDTNIIVYSLDQADPQKLVIAKKLVTQGVTSGLGVISYQVVQEFFNVSLRNFSRTMTPDELEQFFGRILLPMMRVSSSVQLFLDALQRHGSHRIEWYDSLIVSAALRSNCKVLYSEDLQHGRRFDDLVIENPFLNLSA